MIGSAASIAENPQSNDDDDTPHPQEHSHTSIAHGWSSFFSRKNHLPPKHTAEDSLPTALPSLRPSIPPNAVFQSRRSKPTSTPKPKQRQRPAEEVTNASNFRRALALPLGRAKVTHRRRNDCPSEELSVANLRRIYSSLLEEMAPSHHGLGTGGGGGGANDHDHNSHHNSHHNNAWRWKNRGTITVQGSDDEGYDYAYSPDDSKKSWRLTVGGGGNGVGGATTESNDGIRRYHTGGAVVVVGSGSGSGAAGTSSRNIISIGSMDVDVGSIDGVHFDVPAGSASFGDGHGGRQIADSPNVAPSAKEDVTLAKEGIDATTDAEAEEVEPEEEEPDEAEPEEAEPEEEEAIQREKEEYNDDSDMVDVDIAPSSSMEDIELGSPTNADKSQPPQRNESTMTITAFESLCHLSPTLAWRLRSAYAPVTPQEHHLFAVGSDLAVMARRDSQKADGILRGLDMARATEESVCEGLRKVGALVSSCERWKGNALARTRGKKISKEEEENGASSDDDEDDDEMEAAEAVFAYFCEKNVLPMLVDSFLCRPPPYASPTSSKDENDGIGGWSSLREDVSEGHDSSPFSGVTWTASVKAQILQTLSMLVFNTASPLSLTYLLSNNYMNELIMGMLPLSQWREDALEELLPPFVTLIKGLVMKLRGDDGTSCVPLLLCQRPTIDHAKRMESTETFMPLFHAAVNVLVSPCGSSLRDVDGSLVRTTAMNAILNLCRVTDVHVRSLLVGVGVGVGDEDEDEDESPTYSKITKSSSSSNRSSFLPSCSILTVEQDMLFSHMCKNLISCYNRSVRLIMASLSLNNENRRPMHPHHRSGSAHSAHPEICQAKEEARERHADVAKSLLSEVRYWLGFVDDLLSCSIRVINVRLCEIIIREVVVGTVLFRWNHSPSAAGASTSFGTRTLRRNYKAIAETRASLWFLAQLFGMVEYPPLIRMAATVVFHERYPKSWCDDSRDTCSVLDSTDFFVVTPALNALVTGRKIVSYSNREPRVRDGERSRDETRGQEADAGAGGGGSKQALSPSLAADSSSNSVETDDDNAVEAPNAAVEHVDEGVDGGPDPRIATDDTRNEADLLSNEFVPNPFRSSLLNMLAGQAALEDSVLSSMLFATILENDAMDGDVLDTLDAFFPFEKSLAAYLRRDLAAVHGADANPPSLNALARAMENFSSLGMMLVERIIYHQFFSSDIEDLRYSRHDPFIDYCKASEWISALGESLSYFAAYSRTLSQSKILTDLFAEFMEIEIGQRYSKIADQSPLHPGHNGDIMTVCHLHNFFPSNLIENANTLTNDGIDNDQSAGSSNEMEAAKFAIRITLHLRCLKKCIEEFRERFSSIVVDPRSNRWYDEDDYLSFRTTQKADDAILVIGGIQATRLPQVGTDIDLRGRTFFYGSFPTRASPRMTSFNKGAKSNDFSHLAIVIDPSEIYVASPKKGDPNRCTVISVVSLRTIIASATEGALLHVAFRRQQEFTETKTENIIFKDGKMSLQFESSATSVVVKECLDKYCEAYRSRIASEINNMLDALISNDFAVSRGIQPTSPDPKDEEEWADFQGA